MSERNSDPKNVVVPAVVIVLLACIAGTVILGFAPDTESAIRARSVLAMVMMFILGGGSVRLMLRH